MNEPRPERKVKECPFCGQKWIGGPAACPECGALPGSLSKREQFAAMAMQGLCYSGRMDFFDREWNIAKGSAETKAEIAVKCADALIAELTKEPKR